MPLLRVRCPAERAAERAYTLEVVLDRFLGLPYHAEFIGGDLDETVITLDSAGGIVRIPDRFLSTLPAHWLTEQSARPEVALLEIPPRVRELEAEARIPAPFFDAAAGGSALVISQDGAMLGFDLLGAVFFFLTRYEEAAIGERDRWGRFPSTASVAGRHDFVDRPVVNEYVELLWNALRTQWPGVQRRPRQYRLHLTHDVDRPWLLPVRPLRSVARSVATDLVMRRNPRLARARCTTFLAARSGRLDTSFPGNTFDFLMRESEANGVESAFYFKAGRTNTERDAAYSLRDRWIRALMRRVVARGHRVGLHPSFESHRDPDRILEEMRRFMAALDREGIVQDRVGGRQHYLRWENPVTWRAWEAAGLSYDSTLGFPDRVGFRAGVCYEYPVFDVRARRRLELVERPLIAMESSALAPEYMGLDDDAATEVLVQLGNRCRRYQGDFVVLWHNSELVTSSQRQMYRNLIPLIS